MLRLTTDNVADLAEVILEAEFLPLDYATHGRCPECRSYTEAYGPISENEDLPICYDCGDRCLEAYALLEIGKARANEIGLGDFVEGYGTKWSPYKIAVPCSWESVG